MKTLLVAVALMAGACSRGPDCSKLGASAPNGVEQQMKLADAIRSGRAEDAAFLIDSLAQQRARQIAFDALCR